MSGKRQTRAPVIREFKNNIINIINNINNSNVLFMNSNHDGAGVDLQELVNIYKTVQKHHIFFLFII
jgi:hypothetical protein